ncbi:MAG: hypothetical protein JRH17_07685 [Deltaproteobacteria bacterium]|nr:hypothetical protein [Deltaproteobacteria bacterium]
MATKHRLDRTRREGHRGRWRIFTLLASTLLLFGFGAPESCSYFAIEVLSSPPEYVSGDDARVAIHVSPFVSMPLVEITVDGRDVTDSFERVGWTRRLEGLVTGLAPGDNLLEVRTRGFGRHGRSAELVLTNHSVSGPIFSGPQQVPFLCADAGDRANAELGPALDADCMVETVVSFKYRTTGGSWADYDPDMARPTDMAQTTTMNGDIVDFIVRWERGTINRFIYSIALLSPAEQDASTPELSAWNGRLIYYFQGGVAIGHYQGDPSRSRMLYEYGLGKGYAVAYSTGTKTGTHYNLELGGETAIMVKDRFVSAYANPDYTVGVGGSGGGIQQYVYGQNHKGLINAGIPQYSYPDMITQTIHIGDCELLERWMDIEVLFGNAKWADWENRTEIEGLNAINGFGNPYLPLLPFLPQGSSECVNAWRGLSPLVLNPSFGTVPGISLPDQASTEWTHFGDAINIYGVAADGFAASTWDNVGVQYGLEALVSGFVGADEFVDLNAQVGSWKNEPDMVQEGCPFLSFLCPSLADLLGLAPIPDIYPNLLDPWSWRNMALSPDFGITPAPRKEADPGAIEAAYAHGHVNRGDVQIPMIDWRNYLEDELDMHNSHQSFAGRQRLLDYDGDASNQVIWFTDLADFDQTPMAFEVIDEWMRNIHARPWKGVAANKPAEAVDSCFDPEGNLIYAGEDAWSGILDDEPAGPCTQEMPVYATSRIMAGGPITGDVLKCHLISIDEALAEGFYGDVVFDGTQRARLDAIFPTGVCDYSQGDARRP